MIVMRHFYFFSSAVLLASCSGESNDISADVDSTQTTTNRLPFLGFHDVQYIEKNGIQVADTLYHTVPDFALVNQNNALVTGDDVKGKIHVVNFFFTHCPAICPAMIKQMQRMQENTKDVEELIFLSHTIDPERDSLPRLNEYISERNIDTSNWHFLWGEREEVYLLGQEGYMINAMEDEYADGGFLHSEHFVLVDREGHVRGLYEGTIPARVDQMEKDIRRLITEEYGN